MKQEIELGGAQEILLPRGSYYPARMDEEVRNWEATKYLFYVIFKWKRLILGLFLAFSMGAGAGLWVKPPLYKASAKILVQADRTSLQISGLSPQSSRLAITSQVM